LLLEEVKRELEACWLLIVTVDLFVGRRGKTAGAKRWDVVQDAIGPFVPEFRGYETSLLLKRSLPESRKQWTASKYLVKKSKTAAEQLL
jgi:hypothetical protein